MSETPPRLGKYEILEEIGRGGFAVVYKARDTELDRVVALKVLHPQLTTDPKFIQRFHQEARIAAGLHRPHIVTIHEVGEEAGQHYLAMAFLPGRTLDKRLAGGPLPVEQAVAITEQVAGALDVIHERGLVHRDIKPANIMVDDAGRATLLDFGIVRAAEGTRLTTTMAVLGTPEYMAPEQAELEEAREIDWRADIYALGIVAYEMLVGRPPFTGKSPTAILHKHVYEPPPAPTALNPVLPSGLEPVLLKTLAKGREERFQRAGTFAARLRAALRAESQIRQREAQLAPLYERLQAAAVQEDWAEVLTLGGQIRALDPGYRDVPKLMEQARAEMRHPPRKPMPTWLWITGGIMALALLIGLVVKGLSPGTTAKPTDVPTETPTRNPTRTPTVERMEEPRPSLGDTWTRPADGMVMVHVPAGKFEMGSTEGASDEQPVHTVSLDGFWIDRTEVTNAQYQQCVEGRSCQAPTTCDWGEPTYEDASKADHPVVCVDWHGAQAYCEWAGARLPTEAEWEYAARGPQGFTYPWGNEFDCSRGNFDDETELDDYVVSGGEGCDGYVKTAPVGSFPTGGSWCEALDMAGNVWEWVADWYGDYPSTAQTNPIGPDTGYYKVLRGGGWYGSQPYIRSAYRGDYSPGLRAGNGGFRCCVASRQD